MSDAGQMFSDGKTYERMMDRWSKLAGRIFLDWLDAPQGLNWSRSAAATAPSPRS